MLELFQGNPRRGRFLPVLRASQKDNPVAEIMAIEERLKRPDLPQAERERLTKELDDIRDMVTGPLKIMEPGILEQMRNLANECETADDFMAAIFIGDCPKCGSNKTQDCENVAIHQRAERQQTAILIVSEFFTESFSD